MRAAVLSAHMCCMNSVEGAIPLLWTALAFIALASALFAATFVRMSRGNRHARASLDAQRAMYEGQYAAIWREAYDQGIEDERMAAEHNTGTHEKVSANRANPYATEAGAR